MHRLLLRPAARAIRVQGVASSSRDIIRAISTTPCSNFGATGPVNKAKKLDTLDAAFFDAVLGGEAEAGAVPEAEVEVKKATEVKAKKATKPKSTEATEIKGEPGVTRLLEHNSHGQLQRRGRLSRLKLRRH